MGKTGAMGRRGGRDRSGRRDDGVALLLVLLLVAVLSAIVVEFVYEMRVEAALAENFGTRFEARLGAKSAVALGMGLIALDEDNPEGTTGAEFDALTDAWAAGIRYQELGPAAIRCSVADEFGKLNLNALLETEVEGPAVSDGEDGGGQGEEASGDGDGEEGPSGREVLQEALRQLFFARGAETDPVDAILDWLDMDGDTRTEGCESPDLTGEELTAAIKNGPLDSIEELLLVPGITPELYFGLEGEEQLPLSELLTVHGHPEGRINANTAPLEVLEAMGEALGRPEVSGLILDSREDAPFQKEADLVSMGIVEADAEEGEDGGTGQGDRDGDGDANGNGEEDEDTEAWKPFTVQGGVFRVQGDAEAGGSLVRITAFVERPVLTEGAFAAAGNKYRLLDWSVLE